MILVDNDGLIIDCLRRIGGDLSGKRSVLPGLIYKDPPVREGRLDPLGVTASTFQALFDKATDTTADKWLNSNFIGMSPLICREIIWRAYDETDHRISAIKDNGAALFRELQALIEKVKSSNFEPWMISTEDGSPKDFSYTCIKQYENTYKLIQEDNFSFMLDSFFTRSEQKRRMDQRSAATLKAMITARDRLIRKLAIQKVEVNETSKKDYHRQCGDLVIANLHLIRKGQKSLIAEDFYSENNELREIQLDPMKTPQQNAAVHYKAYTKAKNAGKFLDEQIRNGEKELEYIESVIENLHRIENEQDLTGIRNELMQTGYIKIQKQNKKIKNEESAPLRFISSSGIQILVGRNNVQNDKLTLKSASKSDIWLHAQKIHGAHVIIDCSGIFPDEQTLNDAATLAAYYSAARSGTKVPVDYTYVKNVKKPSGGRPGMVIYNDYKTIIASPDEKTVLKLQENL